MMFERAEGWMNKERLNKADEPTRREFAARAARTLLGVGLLPSIFPGRAVQPHRPRNPLRVPPAPRRPSVSSISTWPAA